VEGEVLVEEAKVAVAGVGMVEAVRVLAAWGG